MPETLLTMRTKAIRRKVWYRVLDSVERGIVNLTLRIFEDVKSLTLCQILNTILEKLRVAIQSRFLRHVEHFGRERAAIIVSQAIGFGSSCAGAWLGDTGFHRWLSLHDIHSRYNGIPT